MTVNPKQDIIDRIDRYRLEIKLMDTKVREYLVRRDKRPNPQYQLFVEEIRRFENRNHLNVNRDVQYHLERLMDTLHMYEQSWKKMFDRDDELFRKQYEARKKTTAS